MTDEGYFTNFTCVEKKDTDKVHVKIYINENESHARSLFDWRIIKVGLMNFIISETSISLFCC